MMARPSTVAVHGGVHSRLAPLHPAALKARCVLVGEHGLHFVLQVRSLLGMGGCWQDHVDIHLLPVQCDLSILHIVVDFLHEFLPPVHVDCSLPPTRSSSSGGGSGGCCCCCCCCCSGGGCGGGGQAGAGAGQRQ